MYIYMFQLAYKFHPIHYTLICIQVKLPHCMVYFMLNLKDAVKSMYIGSDITKGALRYKHRQNFASFEIFVN